ncbi:MAG: phenylalanine--tRNA ligase subunit alpha [Proteobacteria bacterium]|nr:phenylalanine--tRNA ligase subunit alpha [Pseudomonadota bacterium]
MVQLPELDYRVLSALAATTEPVAIDALALRLGLDQAQVAAVCLTRALAGEVAVEEERYLELKLGAKGKALVGRPLPERAVIEALARAGGQATLQSLPEQTGLPQKEVGQALRWLKHRGWAEQQGPALALCAAGRAALSAPPAADEALLAALVELGTATEEALRARGIDFAAARRLLEGRSGLLEERERTTRRVALAAAGRALVTRGIAARSAINQLNAELLRNGGWREVELRPYDVTLPGPALHPGKSHPLVRIFEQTRRVFLELGFDEIDSAFVESAFWDFDALFSPQDHPARDMQDTFYVAAPARCALPEEALVRRVARTHEDGGESGSIGWRYRWDPELARRPLLRTHTTAATIRALAADPRAPRKVFCVGPVFRRETVDYKHLPVFHQVDGIIVDEQASFATLLGTLQAFYRKMGFERFQFRPGFFPYTEPSVEVFVWLESKQDWVEMGGAGIFRPEVTQPLGCQAPVLAWGLGLERLAMFRYGVASIGELYRARLAWLEEAALCR